MVLNALQVVIDSCCATFAEVNKRGKDFWAEFELYAADLLVGIVVDIALVGMLAPYVRIGKTSVSSGFLGRLQQASAALPSRSLVHFMNPLCDSSLETVIQPLFSLISMDFFMALQGVLFHLFWHGCPPN